MAVEPFRTPRYANPIRSERDDALEKLQENCTMVASVYPGPDYRTFLSPGQKFEPAERSGLGNESLTVARLVRDRFGLLHVTMRTGSGREISAFVEQVELAVFEGQLMPIGFPVSHPPC